MVSPTDMEFLLGIMRCPRTGQKLRSDRDRLLTEDGKYSYRIEDGIPVLLAEEATETAR
jgi:uncharacterized protein YbaR (Trm112 family)